MRSFLVVVFASPADRDARAFPPAADDADDPPIDAGVDAGAGE